MKNLFTVNISKTNIFSNKTNSFAKSLLNCEFLQNYFIKNVFKEKLDYNNLIIMIIMELDERIQLRFNNIGKRFYFPDEFELHRAVFENNLRKINEICKNEKYLIIFIQSFDNLYSNINEIDPQGNSPLFLAIKLNRLDAIKVLCDNNAEIKHVSFEDSISPYDFSIIYEKKEVLKILINSIKKQKLTLWHQSQKDLLLTLRTIPDFSMGLTISLNSSIFSVIKSITPKDNFKVNFI